jgi:hypothetical protein
MSGLYMAVDFGSFAFLIIVIRLDWLLKAFRIHHIPITPTDQT